MKVILMFLKQLFVITLLIALILVATVGSSFWLGELAGKWYYGFFMIATLYGLIAATIYYYQKTFIRR